MAKAAKLRHSFIWAVLGLAGVHLTTSRVEAQSVPAGLLDRKYVSSCGRDKPAELQLKNGKFGRYYLLGDEDRRIELIVLGTQNIAVAGDRRKYYAVFARCKVLGNVGFELFVLRKSPKGFVQIASTLSPAVANLYQVKQIQQAAGQIVVALDYLADRSLTIKRYEFRFKLTGARPELVDQGLVD